MTFDAAKYLGRATGRAKSDVANKLASMYLHEFSRKLSVKIGLTVSDRVYTVEVESTFGQACAYCHRPLEHDRAAVEHLDGMNRYRAGLHIVGNVVVSCKRCNSEKRRDDSTKTLTLAPSGWESFLAHNGKNCREQCKTCAYWGSVLPNENDRLNHLADTAQRIQSFREKFPKAEAFRVKAAQELPTMLEAIYRDGQAYASSVISTAIKTAMEQGAY